MRKICVGFSKPKKWKPFAWLIMKGYNIPYDHVYVRIHSDTYSRDLIYQASSIKVNFMGAELFEADNIIVNEFEVDIADEHYVAMMQFAIDNVGRAYGMKEAFGLAIVRIAELCGKKIKNPFRDSGHTYICSELASYLLQQYAGADMPKDYEDMTPKDVYDYLSSLGNKI
jgi:hypothetical protein